ncbi:hypothetical protein B1987_00995 [Mycobacterium kansasii]|uniref:Putative PPE family protein PPE38 n=1 Tax=Mycobacterium attenuatum TaxID=2341086 RepID=A0A498Q2A1_9MYCO|nr:PPE family protein [Mycobacterium attenuatum]ORB87135.1 hypothetical protein B1987_00995 [Mycobacterium kansasii]VBA39427.1 putative PPE family protein PPE38 [Mycobacterium attenuatum]VBA53926.1 putative PPE family protein PPE38 [Mycobacterium attenuatum]VBA58580.1 putative PPE family protein PPE38 [Mycobacterium attenuatum]
MFFHFSWLPPEVNSARMYSGAGSGSLHAAAAAWQRLAQDLHGTASSFRSVIAALLHGQWAGTASMSMAAAAAPLTGWLTAAAEHAQLSSGQTQAAATAYESAFSATVHPAAVAANRILLATLVHTNFLGQNAPAIATTESAYAEMWAQDVAAMVGYHTKAMTLASTLSPLSAPPTALTGGTAVQPWFPPVTPPIIDPLGPLFNAVSGVLSDLPVSSVLSVAELGMYPVSFMMSPLMMAMSSARGATAGLGAAGSAATAAASAASPVVGGAAPAMALTGLTGLGGAAMPGAAMSAALGQAHTMGAVSVPATWPGSLPSGLSSSAVQGLGSMPTPASVAEATGSTDGVPMMPIAPRAAGSAAATPNELSTRGGVGAAAPALATHPGVIPRAGIG